jgi:hypothetical protein
MLYAIPGADFLATILISRSKLTLMPEKMVYIVVSSDFIPNFRYVSLSLIK